LFGLNKIMNKDKIRGMFLGVAIGDALGMVVEGQKPDVIASKYEKIIDYLGVADHKFHGTVEPGRWTDDTVLTLAVTYGLIDNPFNMEAQVKYHIDAFNLSTSGWGGTTKRAIKELCNGVNWKKSGAKPGTGNGVPMKIAPVGACLAKFNQKRGDILEFIVNLSTMTHDSSISVSAALAQASAIEYCMNCTPVSFNSDEFIKTICQASLMGEDVKKDTITDRLYDRLKEMNIYMRRADAIIIEDFKGGCYCFQSLPLVFAFFLKYYKNKYEGLYEIIAAGGDTDSNASMFGALLGTLYGESVFPKHLIDGLKDKSVLLTAADNFCTKFGF
jgi:ADP-ribosylglycohydrolase